MIYRSFSNQSRMLSYHARNTAGAALLVVELISIIAAVAAI
jgi:hypothetical protein